MLAVCLISVGGTVAWLTDTSNSMVNTFTATTIRVGISGAGGAVAAAEGDGGVLSGTFKMVPGSTIQPDTQVTVAAGSEKCYLFVKVTKSDNYDTYLEPFEIGEGWNVLDAEGADGVYYRVVESPTGDMAYPVVKQVKVKTEITKEQMDSIAASGAPTLSAQAYAVQYENIASAHMAWKQINPGYEPPTIQGGETQD